MAGNADGQLHSFAGIPLAPINERPHFIKALVYGRPGAGKTFFVSKADEVNEMRPVLYLTPDAAEADTLRHSAPNVLGMEITQFDQFEKIYTELAALAGSGKPLPFKTIVVDTGTEAQKLSMRDIMVDLKRHGRPGGGEVNIDVPSQREWGQSINQVRRMVRGFRDLPLNFIMICHESTERDNRGVTWTTPDLPGKLSNQIAGMFSTVVYLYTKQETRQEGLKKIVTRETRQLLTGFTEGYVCKSRSDALPRVIENPSIEELYSKITGVERGEVMRTG